jgi:hypothetical protein
MPLEKSGGRVVSWIDVALYAVGLAAVLAIYLPFSPMTIDLVNLSRAAQIAIYRNRLVLWLIADAAFLVLLLRSLAGAGWLGAGPGAAVAGVVGAASPGWHWVVLVTIAMLAMMFWSGYVPYVMRPPEGPRILSAEEADALVGEDDIVLGVAHQDEARAYSRDLIARPHYYNDTVGGQPFTVSYCILCNSGMAFKSELDGRPMALKCVTAFNNNIIYREPATRNFIQQLDGAVFAGPDAGKQLAPFPVLQMTWGEWKRLHPETSFYHAPHRTVRDRLVGAMLKWMIPVPKLAARKTPWHRIRGRLDDRLPAMSFVLGIEIGGERVAYPLSGLSENPVINDTVGGAPIVVLYDRARDAAAVFAREIDGKATTFEFGPDGGFVDAATGSRWDLTGAAHEGAFANRRLAPVAHYNKLFWFSWALFKPDTRIGPQAAAGAP